MITGEKSIDRLNSASIQQEGNVTEPSLRLYNSMTQKVEPIAPTITPGSVSIYLCGATVQALTTVDLSVILYSILNVCQDILV